MSSLQLTPVPPDQPPPQLAPVVQPPAQPLLGQHVSVQPAVGGGGGGGGVGGGSVVAPALQPPPPAAQVVAVGPKNYEYSFVKGFLHLTVTDTANPRLPPVEKYFKITGAASNQMLARKIIDAYAASNAMQKMADAIIAQEVDNAAHAVQNPSTATKLKFTIKADQLEVARYSKETGQEVAGSKQTKNLGELVGGDVQQARIARSLKRGFEEARDHIRIKNELVNQLNREGFKPDTVKATITKIFEEGQLGLLRDQEDDLADVTLSDLLQYPGNESVFGALKEVQEKSFDLVKRTKGVKQIDDQKKCREAILDVILRNVHRPPKVIVDRENNYAIVQRVYQGSRAPTTAEDAYLSLDEAAPTDLDALPKIAEVDKGFSSESDKRPEKNAELDKHNTNMASVAAHNANGSSEVVVVRSGKTTTFARGQELAEFALSEELRSGKTAALRPAGTEAGKPVYEFRPAITTHMDMGRLKEVGGWLSETRLFKKFGWTAGESELTYTKEIAKAIDNWPAEGIKVKKRINNQDAIVVLKKPIVSNQLFSFQVKGIGHGDFEEPYEELGQGAADKFNGIANQQYLYDFMRDNPVVDPLPNEQPTELNIALIGMKTAAAKLNATLIKKLGYPEVPQNVPKESRTYVNQDSGSPPGPLDGLIDFDKLKLLQFFEKNILDTDAFKAYERAVAKFLLKQLQSLKQSLEAPQIADGERKRLNELKNMTTALYAIHFRRMPPEPGTPEFGNAINKITKGEFKICPDKADPQLHAADMEIYRNMLCTPYVAAGVKKTKCEQCKSGVDRTGLGVALAVAQERFRRTYGYSFKPGDDISPSSSNPKYIELLYFKKFFREAIVELAVPLVVETKGFSGLRWAEGFKPWMVNVLGGADVNPVAHKYLFLEEDVLHLHLVDEARTVPDVVGLSYADLDAARRKKQYKGHLNVAVADRFYLQSTDDKRKEVAEHQKELSPTLKGEVLSSVKAELHAVGITDAELPTTLLNNGLQLNCHISQLSLGKKLQPNNPNSLTRLEALEVKVRELSARPGQTEKDKMVIRTLKRIIAHEKRMQVNKNNQAAADALAKGVSFRQVRAQAGVNQAAGGGNQNAAAAVGRLNQFNIDEANEYAARAEQQP